MNLRKEELTGMTVARFYALVGGNYEETLGRFRDEERILKFLKMFLNDTSISDLKRNMQEGNYDEAFRAAHTLKGVASNMGMTVLQREASEMTEILRERDIEAAKAFMPRMDEICDRTLSALNELLGE